MLSPLLIARLRKCFRTAITPSSSAGGVRFAPLQVLSRSSIGKPTTIRSNGPLEARKLARPAARRIAPHKGERDDYARGETGSAERILRRSVRGHHHGSST